jgi:hypothetical protein
MRAEKGRDHQIRTLLSLATYLLADLLSFPPSRFDSSLRSGTAVDIVFAGTGAVSPPVVD